MNLNFLLYFWCGLVSFPFFYVSVKLNIYLGQLIAELFNSTIIYSFSEIIALFLYSLLMLVTSLIIILIPISVLKVVVLK